MPGLTATSVAPVGGLGAVLTTMVRAGELPAALFATMEYVTSKLLPGLSDRVVSFTFGLSVVVVPVPVRVITKALYVPDAGLAQDRETSPTTGEPANPDTGSGGDSTETLVL